ncbi:hypothetical protein PGT21_004736 [Puccinia graminis f. sp. tritici]|uniref:Uncharacterized protein n=1 Tax=Puccinia graminis f. sp. tritici TaxID=56615 RepID=A0A5B0QHF1_PUCGR|nr:hypothetical protein PGT21_004736 [Puccinia graminis f. sp. tritici]
MVYKSKFRRVSISGHFHSKLKTAKDQKRARQLESEETRGGGKAAQGHRVVNDGKPSKDRRFSLNEIEDFGSSSLINTVARLS